METPSKKKSISSSKPCGSPVLQEVSFVEAVRFGNGTIHKKSFTFSQLWDKGTEVTQIKVSNFQIPSPTRKKRKQITSSNELPKKKMRPPEESAGAITDSTERRYRLKMIFYWVVVAGAAAVISISNFPGKKSIWPLFQLEGELANSLYGQTNAIEILIETLEITMMADQPTVIVFTGTTGVGKSYTASIVQKYFPWKSKIIFLVAEKLPEFDLVTLASSTSPGWNLLIVEDCSYGHDDAAVNIVKSLMGRAKKIALKLIVIVIYTYRVPNELEYFLKEKLEPELSYFHVPFQSLDREAVTQCFLRELEKEGLLISSNDLEKMVVHQMEYIDEIRGPPGCKQVETKVIQLKSRADSYRSDDEL